MGEIEKWEEKKTEGTEFVNQPEHALTDDFDNGSKYDEQTNLIQIQGRLAFLTSEPIALICPHCNKSVSTRVKSSATLRTHTFAAMLLVFCCLPLVLLPYCIDSCQKAVHYCPKCKEYIATYTG